jgi:uncharacterized protein YecE (DUF72 family)
MSIYFGCPVWSFKGWVGNFYPNGTRPGEYLREYARRLTAIEGNTTFYAVPTPETIAGWTDATPPSFQFCPKLPKAVSHEGGLAAKIDLALAFVDALKGLGPRLGPMFLQLPPRFAPSLLGDLRSFLEAWPRGLRLAVEVRHPHWFDPPHSDALDLLLSDSGAARVTIDTRPIRQLAGDERLAGTVYQSLLEARERKPDVPVLPSRTADFVFIRYIGHPTLDDNHSYLDEWSGYLSAQLKGGAEGFVFCHSPGNMIAPILCRELHRRIVRIADIPPLPWDQAGTNSSLQPGLF